LRPNDRIGKSGPAPGLLPGSSNRRQHRLALAIGRIPGLSIDRAGISLVGASLMIAFGTLSLEEAFKAVDLDAIALLLGMTLASLGFGTWWLS
jgi:hypothetical protein